MTRPNGNGPGGVGGIGGGISAAGSYATADGKRWSFPSSAAVAPIAVPPVSGVLDPTVGWIASKGFISWTLVGKDSPSEATAVPERTATISRG